MHFYVTYVNICTFLHKFFGKLMEAPQAKKNKNSTILMHFSCNIYKNFDYRIFQNITKIITHF